MARLLIFVDVFSSVEQPLSKKKAWSLVGVSDVKTARKYVTRAIELGLVEVVRSEHDKRVENLLPTARLKEMLLAEFADIQFESNRIVELPLPPNIERSAAEIEFKDSRKRTRRGAGEKKEPPEKPTALEPAHKGGYRR
jgi:hypothetical protein